MPPPTRGSSPSATARCSATPTPAPSRSGPAYRWSASVALHESLGFVCTGVNREIGWKQGAWRDVGWYQLELAPAGAEPPPDPLPPERA